MIEGTEVLKGFQSVKKVSDAWPKEEFKIWQVKVTRVLDECQLHDYYPLWFRDVRIDIQGANLSDFIEACKGGLNRLEELLKHLCD